MAGAFDDSGVYAMPLSIGLCASGLPLGCLVGKVKGMPDIATIGAFLNSLKTATEIAKAIKDLDATVEKAEMKMKLADLLGNLADAKISAAELQDLLYEKQKEIERLNETLRFKAEVVKAGDAYFLKDSKGGASGEPFCPHCWEDKSALFHFTHGPGATWVCTHCKNTYWKTSVSYPPREVI